MDVPMRGRNTRTNSKFPNHSQEHDENLNPPFKLTDRCNSVINKSFGILQQQIHQNQQYLNQFQLKVEKVYKLESIRGALKEREYKNLLQGIQAKKLAATEEVKKINEQNMKDYKSIMEQNCSLHALKGSYQQVLKKLQKKIQIEDQLVRELNKKNQETKQRIKQAWKILGAVHQPSQTEQAPIMRKLKRQITLISKSKKNTIVNLKPRPPLLLQELESLYVTEHQITQPNSCRQQNKPTKLNSSPLKTQEEMKNSSICSSQVTQVTSSLAVYEEAIKKIEDLEMSIIGCKKKNLGHKNVSNSISQQKLRKQKIRQRVEQVEYTIEMLKLFIVYLKSNDNTENKTELLNLRKVICYFEKVLKHKQDILSNIKEMSKNI